MRLQLIRNATLRMEYAGRCILIDPYLATKHSGESFAGRSLNPTIDLPTSIEEILEDVELVVVSHLHQDHFDEVAKDRLPKGLPIICQPGDEIEIRTAGFTDVTPLVDSLNWDGITITRRVGSHGLGPVVDDMGPVMGVSIAAPGEPSIYWAGDTVLYPPVAKVIMESKPDIVITHSCGARWDGNLIVMDADETVAVCEMAKGQVVATHMEALDHATIGRRDLRQAAEHRGISRSKLLIPEDGELIELSLQ